MKLKQKPTRYPRMEVVITPDEPGLYSSHDPQCDSKETVHCCPKCSHLFV